MKKLAVVTLLMIFSTAVQAQPPVKFLEEKTAYCYSEQSLAKYLDHASKRNIDGMNQLVLNGKCDFIPDGKVVLLKKYRVDSIGNTKIVQFSIDDKNCWTFLALVQTADFSNL